MWPTRGLDRYRGTDLCSIVWHLSALTAADVTCAKPFPFLHALRDASPLPFAARYVLILWLFHPSS